MAFLRHKAGRAVLAAALLTMPVSFCGCFATQQDLDPIRSDISVLEKQFMDVQKQYAREKYAGGGNSTQQEMGDRISDTSTRLSAMEKRLDVIEAKLGMSAPAPAEEAAPPEPTPAAPEPIPAEPAVQTPAETPEPEPSAPQPTGEMEAASGLFNQAKEAFDKGDYDTASTELAKFLSAYPNDRQGDEARYMLGEVYYARKDYARAAAEYERVPADYPVADRVPDALYKAGMCQEALGDPGKAREDYIRVMDNYPYSEAAKGARERLDNLKQ